jgi:uncharacterized damage-inducible protein DinB
MALSQQLLPEFDQEMTTTRKTLERVPEEKFAWKPHEKSMSLGALTSHIAGIPNYASLAISQKEFDLAPPGQEPIKPTQAASRQEALDIFDRNRAAARDAIAAADDRHLLESWSLLSGGKSVMTLPRVAVLRILVMNHIIHHRAQLGVYLRLLDVPVPSIYGPSADEGKM